MKYPKSYHQAAHHLVAFGGHGGNTLRGRKLIAKALRDLRAIDKELARQSRYGLRFIAGQFPVKPTTDS